MAVAWGGICCSDPPCVCVSLRKATYSYGNLVERKAYTVNVPSEKYIKEADYAGIYSGRDLDKFTKIGLTPVKSDIVDAPFVDEFPLVVECKLLHTIEIGLHTQFIGQIMDVKADDSVFGERDKLDIEKVKPFVFNPGNRKYNAIGKYLGDAFSIGKNI